MYIHIHIDTYVNIYIYRFIYVCIRAGLRVCPERDERRLEEAHFTAQAQCFMTLVHLRITMCHVKF